MSAILLTSAVVIAAIVVVARVAVADQDELPARGRRRRPAVTDAGPPTGSRSASSDLPASQAIAWAESDLSGMRVYPARPSTLWARTRSACVLVGLASILGALMALACVGLIVGVAFAISGVRR